MLGNIIAALQEGLDKPTEMSEEMSEEKLTALKVLILQKIAAQPTVTAKSLAQVAHVSARTVERALKTLQQKGKLQRIGAKKGGIWRLC